jgi:RNA polymerase sigma-70 factor (ECF subfamily)
MPESEADQYIRDLFLSWYPTAVRCAYRLCGSVEAAEDAVQESFRQLFLALRNGVDVQNGKAWTLCVIRREVARIHRAEVRRAESLEPTDIMDARPAIDIRDGIPVESDDLSRLLEILSPREREVVLLRTQGFRYQEIASELHIRLNSVKTLLARGLRKLQTERSSKNRTETPKKYVSETLH